jgi:hypothetical protein
VASVAVRGNLIEVMKRSVGVERVDEDGIATAVSTRERSASVEIVKEVVAKEVMGKEGTAHMRDVSSLMNRVDVNRMTAVPQRYPRLVRLRVVKLFDSSIEVDDLLKQLTKSARFLIRHESLRDGSSRLIDSRRREAECRRGEGEVGTGSRCGRDVSTWEREEEQKERIRTNGDRVNLLDALLATVEHLPATQRGRLCPRRSVSPFPLRIQCDKLMRTLGTVRLVDGEGRSRCGIGREGEEVEEEGVEGAAEEVVNSRGRSACEEGGCWNRL